MPETLQIAPDNSGVAEAPPPDAASHAIVRLVYRETSTPETDATSLPGTTPSHFSDPEIDLLYRELRRLASADDEVAYQEVLSRLRSRQQEEADRIEEFLRGQRRLEPGALDETLRRARDLLDDANSPASNSAPD